MQVDDEICRIRLLGRAGMGALYVRADGYFELLERRPGSLVTGERRRMESSLHMIYLVAWGQGWLSAVPPVLRETDGCCL